MRSLGRPLMYSWKKLQRRMESWGAPALTEKSCKHFPRRTNRSYLVDESSGEAENPTKNSTRLEL